MQKNYDTSSVQRHNSVKLSRVCPRQWRHINFLLFIEKLFLYFFDNRHFRGEKLHLESFLQTQTTSAERSTSSEFETRHVVWNV